ncbi:GDSL esterase/lipase At5g55050-like [Impatiens glandulifera]|uniref:GDSL esterase/lipase At5g55050-like n=1 Tax=Impatiens glandulifera TaxID=253017 RepID=UPI001FB0B577|nr:GDSL esterase/lipase At5g55050-like [Impatiens glandulifera]
MAKTSDFSSIHLGTMFFAVALVVVFFLRSHSVAADNNPPALFIFGDSTADVGTNTYLPNSLVRADFPFYGIDFLHSKPTGRFSNGFNSADFLGKLMGLRRSPPPFLLLVDTRRGIQKHACKGVNFASAGAGLLDDTGRTLGVVPMSKQIEQFTTVHSNLTSLLGNNKARELLKQAIFSISIGSNDILGYFATNSTIPKEQFIVALMITYRNQVKALYDLGARKFGIISVPPIGCCPSQRLHAAGNCFEAMNDFATSFYTSLDSLLRKLSTQLQGIKYSLGNTYEMTINVIKHPLAFNFTDVKGACCGGGTLNAVLPCNATANLCPNRKQYLFWDLFHPTQVASQLAAVTLFSGGPQFVSPINFGQLVEGN